MPQHVSKYGLGDDTDLNDMNAAIDSTIKFLNEFHSKLTAHLGEQGASETIMFMALSANDKSNAELNKYVDQIAGQLDDLLQWEHDVSNPHFPTNTSSPHSKLGAINDMIDQFECYQHNDCD